ncbi:MAG: sigma-E processing peptidase SpoIIGA [Oscillospiraceae bacterium]|nr:sigma-E processing peptidase SpoIIGA [Oscillospiraceae bacterium]
MTVYADAVFVLNFSVNYLLLRASARLGGAAIRTRRLLLGALLGAAYAVAVYLPGLRWMTLFPCKVLCAAGMIVLSFGWRRSTFRLAAVFGGMTLVLCGAVYGVELLRGGQLHYRENALFYPVSFFSLLLTAAAVSAACRLLLPKLTFAADSILPVTLRLRGRTVRLSALRDSGNTLCDPVSGENVLTVYWRAVRGLFPCTLSEAEIACPATFALKLKDYAPRLIPYRAVGVPSGLLLAIPCEITINNRTKTGLIALSPTPVSARGAYEALTGGNQYA